MDFGVVNQTPEPQIDPERYVVLLMVLLQAESVELLLELLEVHWGELRIELSGLLTCSMGVLCRKELIAYVHRLHVQGNRVHRREVLCHRLLN